MGNKTLVWAAAGATLVGGAAAFYFWQQSLPPPQLLEPVAPSDAAATRAEPSIRYPITQTDEQATETLPTLDQSDRTLRDELENLIGLQALKTLFHSENIVRNVVVTVDNLPRKTVALRVLPTQPVGATFVAARQGGQLVIAEKNAARYRPYVRLLQAVDTKNLTALYTRFYPLFQRAYQEQGYPKEYFNDRLVDVIDHMLDAPEVDGPIALTQPHVVYRYADPDLENASAGHKVMIRMGADNAAKVKAKLREIRRELTAQGLQK
jgi:hypothetical protein